MDKMQTVRNFIEKVDDEIVQFDVESKTKTVFVIGQKWDYRFNFSKDSVSVIEKKEDNPKIYLISDAGI